MLPEIPPIDKEPPIKIREIKRKKTAIAGNGSSAEVTARILSELDKKIKKTIKGAVQDHQ